MVTGKFVADFASFHDAVTKADVQLKSFEANANKVGTSLNRMVDNFSGRKLIQDATLMTASIEKIGGVSRLTDAELQRVSTTVVAATAKMRTMGIDVPPGMQKIVDASKILSSSFKQMTDSFSGQKLIQEATVMVAALEKAGGVSKLTEAELRRVGATVTEAAEKMKRMGQEVPPGFQKISDAAKALDGHLATNVVSFRDVATAAAAIGGIVAGVSLAIGKIGERGAGVNDVRVSFDQLTDSIGGTSSVILGKLRTATLGTISDFDLMATANKAMSQGLKLTADQFGVVGDVAAVLADRTGGDLKTAFDTLTQAMATGQDRTLKTIGFNIDAAKATDAYAASIGKKTSELDEEQKKQAISNAILSEGQHILAQSGKAQVDFADKVGQSRTNISNFVDGIGSWVATSPSIGAWTSSVTAASSGITALGIAFGPASRGIAKLLGDGTNLGAVMTSLTSTAGGLAPTLGKLGTAASTSGIAVAGLQAGLIGLGVGVTLALVFHQLDKLKADLHSAADAFDRLPRPIDATNQKLAEQAKQINENNVTLNRLRGGMEAVIEPSGALGQALLKTAKGGGEFSKALKQAHADIAAMTPALRTDLVQALKSGAFSMDELQKKSKLSETAFKIFAKEVQEAGKSTQDSANKITAAFDKMQAAMVPLTEAQKTQVIQWHAWGVSTETAATALGVSSVAIDRYLDGLDRLYATTLLTIPVLGSFNERIDLQNDLLENGVRTMDLIVIETDRLGKVTQTAGGLFQGLGGMTKTFSTEAADAAAKINTLGKAIQDSFGKALENIPDLLKKAFTGGGDLVGAVKAIGVDLAESLTAPIIAALSKVQKQGLSVGTALSAGLGGAVGGSVGATVAGIASGLGGAAVAATAFGKGLATAGVAGAVGLGAVTLGIGAAAVGVVALISKWKNHQKEVQENTKRIAEFQDSIIKTLTPMQRAEAAGRPWAASVIGIRDAYLATGRSAEDAERDTKAMWDSTTQGAGASQAAIDRVNTAFIEQKQKLDDIATAATALEAIRTQYAGIEERLTSVVTISSGVKDALAAAFDAETTDAYKLALDQVNAALDAQGAEAKLLEDTMKKYGLAWTDLGAEARKAKVAEVARGIIKEFEVLERAGVNVNTIMAKMGPTVNDFVKAARQSGTEVPEEFRKIIQAGIDAGVIFGDDKKKILDMKDAGVTFGKSLEETMAAASKSMAASIEKLVEIIEKKLGPAIKNIPDGSFEVKGKFIPPKIPKGYKTDWPDELPAGEMMNDAIPMAKGGTGKVTKPTLFLVGEAGPEEYAFSGANKTFSRLMGDALGGSTKDAAGAAKTGGGDGAVASPFLPSKMPKAPKGFDADGGREVAPMAQGGRGKVTKPTLFLVGEAGPEEYLFSGTGKTFTQVGGASMPKTFVAPMVPEGYDPGKSAAGKKLVAAVPTTTVTGTERSASAGPSVPAGFASQKVLQGAGVSSQASRQPTFPKGQDSAQAADVMAQTIIGKAMQAGRVLTSPKVPTGYAAADKMAATMPKPMAGSPRAVMAQAGTDRSVEQNLSVAVSSPKTRQDFNVSDGPMSKGGSEASKGGAFMSPKLPQAPKGFDATGGSAVMRMAQGGKGTVTKPTLFLVGEAGPEEYLFSGTGKTFKQAVGAAAPKTFTAPTIPDGYDPGNSPVGKRLAVAVMPRTAATTATGTSVGRSPSAGLPAALSVGAPSPVVGAADFTAPKVPTGSNVAASSIRMGAFEAFEQRTVGSGQGSSSTQAGRLPTFPKGQDSSAAAAVMTQAYAGRSTSAGGSVGVGFTSPKVPQGYDTANASATFVAKLPTGMDRDGGQAGAGRAAAVLGMRVQGEGRSGTGPTFSAPKTSQAQGFVAGIPGVMSKTDDGAGTSVAQPMPAGSRVASAGPSKGAGFTSPKAPKGYDPSAWPDIIPMAQGGKGTASAPAVFLAGEAGPEAYAFSGAGKAFGPSGTQLITVLTEKLGPAMKSGGGGALTIAAKFKAPQSSTFPKGQDSAAAADVMAQATGKAVESGRNFTVEGKFTPAKMPKGADGTAPEVLSMAKGGMGRVTKPTLFVAGDAGAEDYAFSGGGQSFGKSRSGSGSGPSGPSGSGTGGKEIVIHNYVMLDGHQVAKTVERVYMAEQRRQRRLNAS